MPIYEYRCEDCRRRVSVFQRSMVAPVSVACDRCGSTRLTRLVSRFSVVRSPGGVLDEYDESGPLQDVDENDPRSVARWARRMGSELGEEMGPEFDQMVERMEAGEMPEDLMGGEGEDGDSLDEDLE
ncbi:MAG: zinc ribbon domain-containing protein [Dehalococcoidia bacterium]